jgi:hypothetical protein
VVQAANSNITLVVRFDVDVVLIEICCPVRSFVQTSALPTTKDALATGLCVLVSARIININRLTTIAFAV